MQCTSPWYTSKTHILVPCGKCIGCRIARAREWAVRLTHESQYFKDKSFLTLTYNDDNLPDDLALRIDDHQRFMKRVRKRNGKKKLKYFMCGEYGDGAGTRPYNPHYHYIVLGENFGLEDPKEKLFLHNKDGLPVFTTKALLDLWPFGFATVGSVTRESIMYVARYVLKKLDGDTMEGPHLLQPVFQRCSKGLGFAWMFDRAEFLHRHEEISFDGHKVGIPRYYKKRLGKERSDARFAKDIVIPQIKRTRERFGYAMESDVASMRRLELEDEMRARLVQRAKNDEAKQADRRSHQQSSSSKSGTH